MRTGRDAIVVAVACAVLLTACAGRDTASTASAAGNQGY